MGVQVRPRPSFILGLPMFPKVQWLCYSFSVMDIEELAPDSRVVRPAGSTALYGWMLGAGMFFMGGIGLAYEYTFSKLSSDLLGNSARQWAIVIAVMMLFMGVGADAQKYFSGRRLVEKLVVSEILLGLLGGFGPIALLTLFGWAPDHFVLAQYFFIASVGLLIGFEIPLVTRINAQYESTLRYNLGRILKMDYIGALCGALVWIFVLPRFFSLVEGAFVLSFVSMGVAGLTLCIFRVQVERILLLVGAICFAVFVLGVGLLRADDWTAYAEQALYRDPVIYSETSPFQHVVLTQSVHGTLRCYLNGHIQFSSDDEHIYHENLVHPAMSIAPRRDRVLLLGGGDGLALREVLKYGDVAEVVLVDIDPMMTRLAREYPLLRELNGDSLLQAKVSVIESGAVSAGARIPVASVVRKRGRWRETAEVAEVQVMNIDAKRFVQDTSGVFDVILIDFPDPNSPEIAALYSVQFYQAIGKCLSEDGILALQSTSPYHAKEAFLCVGRSLVAAGLAVVPYHDNVPSFGEWGWWIGGKVNVYSPERLKSQLSAIADFGVSTKYLMPELVEASLVFGRDGLKSKSEAVSTLSRPRIFDFYQRSWQDAQ